MKHLSTGQTVGQRMAARQLSTCVASHLRPGGIIGSTRSLIKLVPGVASSGGVLSVVSSMHIHTGSRCGAVFHTMHVSHWCHILQRPL